MPSSRKVSARPCRRNKHSSGKGVRTRSI
jgi:hypothetical protein